MSAVAVAVAVARAKRREGLFFTVIAAIGAVGAVGCVGGGRGRGEVEALAVREVAWNPGRAEVGRVAAVADAGGDVLAVGDQGAFFFTGGALTGSDRRSSRWRGAAAIPASDGAGTWLAAIGERGEIYRVRARSSLEDISDRYGLSGTPVIGLSAMGKGFLGLATASGRLAVADGQTVTMFASGPVVDLARGSLSEVAGGSLSGVAGGSLSEVARGSLSEVARGGLLPGVVFAGGGGKAAWIEDGGVRVLEPRRNDVRFFALAGARRAALDAEGRLFVTTNHAIYAEDAGGALALVHETESPRVTITGLAVSGGRVWFSEGANLGVIERPLRVAITRDLAGGVKSGLTGSPGGDVWCFEGDRLARYAARPAEKKRSREQWSREVSPVFARACGACHGAGGSSGIDLSTFEAWESHRAPLRLRVIEARDMPPRDQPLSEADRAIVDAFTEGALE